MRFVTLLLVLALLAGCSRPVDPSIYADETTTPGAPGATDTPRFAMATPGHPTPGPTSPYATRPPAANSPTPDPPRAAGAGPEVDYHLVVWGETLASIALANNTTVAELMALNRLTDPDRLVIGTTLRIPVTPDFDGPYGKLLPDSEFVYGPGTRDFAVAEFMQPYGGYLAHYSEDVEGTWRSGPEVVELAARRFSISPRLLLALLEYRAGWLTNPDPPEKTYPLGSTVGYRAGLYFQLAWASDQLNAGYYGWRERGLTTARLSDARARLADGLNAGTAGVEYFLAQGNSRAGWERALGPRGFRATYARLFGDPFAAAVEPLVPASLVQPPLELPWAAGQIWYLTSGPHGGWGDGGAWAALDFVAPDGNQGCTPSAEWARAAAAGLVVRAGDGQVVIDLDGDGFEGTGWTLHYSHLASDGRVTAGTPVSVGDPLGHPACEGGYADAAHLHFARRYNGEWIPAAGALPFNLSGWIALGAAQAYDGSMTRDGVTREACECMVDEVNGVKR
jgi:LasA protease